MQLIPGVIVSCGAHLMLQMGEKQQQVRSADDYILRSIAAGLTEEAQLIALVARTEQVDEVLAKLRLAQLVLDYGDYLAPAERDPIEA